MARGVLSICLLLLFGGIAIASTTDNTSAQEMIRRLVANASQTPTGPVENDISAPVVAGCAAFLKSAKDARPLRVALASDYNFFTLEGPLTSLYSDGHYGLFSAPIKLDDATLHDPDLPLNAPPNDNPGFGAGVGGSLYLTGKVNTNGRMVATFCFTQENGVWKAHNFYISNMPLPDKVVKEIISLIEPSSGFGSQ